MNKFEKNVQIHKRTTHKTVQKLSPIIWYSTTTIHPL